MLEPLRRNNLSEQLAQKVADYIEQKQLIPGDALPSSSELAERFGVSRTVVREAVKLLEARGIIDVTNGKRATVKPITSEPLLGFFARVARRDGKGYRTLLEVREAIETQNARLAAQRRSPEELAQLVALVADMRRKLDDIEAYVEVDIKLHMAIATATHNSVLAHLTESTRDAMEVTMLEGRMRRVKQSDTELVQQHHELLVAAIGRSDADAAASIMGQMLADQYAFLTE